MQDGCTAKKHFGILTLFIIRTFPDNPESAFGTGIVRIYRRIRCGIVQNGKFSESLEKPLYLCYNQTAGNVFGNLIQTTGEPLTIKDIARLAGCGVSTVSRALNGSNEISEQTKERINEVIRQYNYTPNGNARRMRRSAEKTILLIVNGSSNLFFSPLIEQIQIAASSAGFQIAVNHIDEQEDEVQFASRLCTELRPAGVIFLGGDMRNFKRSFARIKLPCILSTANAEELGFENLSSVSVDDYEGGRAAAEQLFDRGHKKVGILGGDLSSYGPSGLRYGGFCSVCSERGADIPDSELCAYTFSSAYEAAVALYHKCKGMTAVFAMSDIIAVGAVRAFLDMGKRVPEDISVLGFDGIELSEYSNPRIATLAQPIHQISSLSVRMLVNMIEDGAEASHVTLRAQFRSGGSMGRI